MSEQEHNYTFSGFGRNSKAPYWEKRAERLYKEAEEKQKKRD